MQTIDAGALVKHLYEDVALKHFYGRTLDQAVRNQNYLCELIVKQPTVDAVPVVRCKDCKCFDVTWESVNAPQGCYFCQMHGLMHEPDYYCAEGERREKNDEA